MTLTRRSAKEPSLGVFRTLTIFGQVQLPSTNVCFASRDLFLSRLLILLLAKLQSHLARCARCVYSDSILLLFSRDVAEIAFARDVIFYLYCPNTIPSRWHPEDRRPNLATMTTRTWGKQAGERWIETPDRALASRNVNFKLLVHQSLTSYPFYRRTGITLKEGKLDEHGMEELDGMFSSPDKSPVRNGYGNDTIINSEDMEMGNSTCFWTGPSCVSLPIPEKLIHICR